jgi:hypothetical protein
MVPYIFVQGSSDQSSNRQHRFAAQMKNRYATNNGNDKVMAI